MGDFLDNLKDEAKSLLHNKTNLTAVLFLLVLVLALYLGINQIQQQKIIQSKATEDPIVFTGPNVEQREDKWVALKPQISLKLTSPLGPPVVSSSALSSKITLNPDKRSSGGYIAGETVTINFTAEEPEGPGVKYIHTGVVLGVSTEAEAKADMAKWNTVYYKGFRIDRGETAQRTATVPFYLEYLAEDLAGKREVANKLIITAGSGGSGSTTSNLAATCTGSGKVNLSWAPGVTGADHYVVRVNKDPNTPNSGVYTWKDGVLSWTPVNNGNPAVEDTAIRESATSHTFSVASNTNYGWKIQAVNSDESNKIGGEIYGPDFSCSSASSADKTPPTSKVTLSKTSGYVAGEEITLTFTAEDNPGGSGVSTIHTDVLSGVSTVTEAKADMARWVAGYKGFRVDRGEIAQITAKVPFYLEYLATDKAKNEEKANVCAITAGGSVCK